MHSTKKKTKEDFIENAKKIHCGKYNYSKVDYVNTKTKVCIICPSHGEFWQTPYTHLKGCKCPICSGNLMNTNIFIEKAKEIHGCKYDYSKVEYVNSQTKVCIICPEHGEFWQNTSSHLNGHGCPKCKNEKTSKRCNKGTEQFIIDAKKIHGDKYDYSKVDYVNSQTKICIICPEHGEFWQAPDIHLRGSGCQECGNVSAKEKNKMKQETFIKKAKKIHNEKYDYSNVKYENTDTKVEIICPEHGKFLQTPHHHLHGIGCPICGANNISENKLFNILKENFKDAVSQYSPDFLNENGHKQYIDIYKKIG